MQIFKKSFLLLILSFSLIAGCAEIQPDLTQPENSPDMHTKGILKPGEPDFHGKLIEIDSWSMKGCQQCHGKNYDGGLTGNSCISCHSETAGPENCATCHGSQTSPAPPKDINENTLITAKGVGAHQAHLQAGPLGKQLSCSNCHIVPTGLYDTGHSDSELPAEVTISGFISTLVTNDPSANFYNSNLQRFSPDPIYNYDNLRCSNSYCHGFFKNGNPDNQPVWTDTNSSRCGTCHGDPSKNSAEERALPKTLQEGGSHPNNINCYVCHADVVNQSLKIVDPSKHIDGKLNLFGIDYSY